MSIRQPSRGFFSGLRAGFLALPLIAPAVTITNPEPAAAACLAHLHVARHAGGLFQTASD